MILAHGDSVEEVVFGQGYVCSLPRGRCLFLSGKLCDSDRETII